MRKLILLALLLSGCSLAPMSTSTSDLQGLSKEHCLNAEFDVAGPPPSGRVKGTITPRDKDGNCPVK